MFTTPSHSTNHRFYALGDIFSAYVQTVRPHAHREPLRVNLVGTDGKVIYEGNALIVLGQIERRKDDGVSYTCETDISNQIPESVTVRANCSDYFWWHGHEPRAMDECYDQEKGYFDLKPHESPFGTDFSKGIHMTTIRSHETGEVLKDSKDRNLAVYGYIAWHCLTAAALELYEKGIAFDFCEDGVPCDMLAHLGPKGCLRQDQKTGKWKAAWK